MPVNTPPDPGIRFLLAVLRAALPYLEARVADGDALAGQIVKHLRPAVSCLEQHPDAQDAAGDGLPDEG